MMISDVSRYATVQHRELARAVDALRPRAAVLSSSLFTLHARAHRAWLHTSLKEVTGSNIDISQFSPTVTLNPGMQKTINEALAAVARAPTYDLSRMGSLAEAASFAMELGVQKGIQNAFASLNLPLHHLEMVLQTTSKINADSIFRDLDRFTIVRETVVQQYARLAGVFEGPVDEDLLDAAQETVAAVRAEIALEQPLLSTPLLDIVKAVLQRVQALADNPALQHAVLWTLAWVIGNVLSGVAGAEWTLQRTEDERLRNAAVLQAEAMDEEEQTRMVKGLAEQLRIVVEATELHAVITRSSHLRARPDSGSTSSILLSPGDTVLVREQKNGWLRVTARVPGNGLVGGWVYAKRAHMVLQ